MARNRQRAKQRQAERRAKRIEQGDSPEPPVAEPPVTDPRTSEPAPGIDPELAVGAPPQEEGRSDLVVADDPAAAGEPLLDDDEHLTEDEVLEELDEEEDQGYAPRGRRGEETPEKKHRSRVVQFLIACWAELQRVQWPNRQVLTTLTGVVLGFVLIAGGYLGLLDAIVSRIIQAIL